MGAEDAPPPPTPPGLRERRGPCGSCHRTAPHSRVPLRDRPPRTAFPRGGPWALPGRARAGACPASAPPADHAPVTPTSPPLPRSASRAVRAAGCQCPVAPPPGTVELGPPFAWEFCGHPGSAVTSQRAGPAAAMVAKDYPFYLTVKRANCSLEVAPASGPAKDAEVGPPLPCALRASSPLASHCPRARPTLSPTPTVCLRLSHRLCVSVSPCPWSSALSLWSPSPPLLWARRAASLPLPTLRPAGLPPAHLMSGPTEGFLLYGQAQVSGKSPPLSLGFLCLRLGSSGRLESPQHISAVRLGLVAVWQQRRDLAPLLVTCGQ